MVFDLQSFIHFSSLMILQKSAILQLLTQIFLWKKRYLWSLINLHANIHNDCSSGLNIPIQCTDLLHWVIGESECKIHDNYYRKQVIRNSKYSKFVQSLRGYTQNVQIRVTTKVAHMMIKYCQRRNMTRVIIVSVPYKVSPPQM